MALYIITGCEPKCSCGGCGCGDNGEYVCCSACPPCSPSSGGSSDNNSSDDASNGSGNGSGNGEPPTESSE